MCIETARYYNVLKYSFQLPIIITSSILSILNGTTQNEKMKSLMPLINTIVNIFTALVVSLNNIFLFEAKSNDFRNASIKFTKLNHTIQSKCLEGSFNKDFIDSIMTSYDNIVEQIDTDIPSHICKKIQTQYETKKHLPNIINSGVERKVSIVSFGSSPKRSPFKRFSTFSLKLPQNFENNNSNSSV
jgi:hypothetical protein